MAANHKVAVITGASQGIGAELVKAYRDRNYFVVANSRSIKASSDDGVLAVPGDRCIGVLMRLGAERFTQGRRPRRGARGLPA
jgi:NAD(P)-dependent dehydrogenase (short-subunit alcohol dehydrogenase family)